MRKKNVLTTQEYNNTFQFSSILTRHKKIQEIIVVLSSQSTSSRPCNEKRDLSSSTSRGMEHPTDTSLSAPVSSTQAGRQVEGGLCHAYQQVSHVTFTTSTFVVSRHFRYQMNGLCTNSYFYNQSSTTSDYSTTLVMRLIKSSDH